jgi:hypothetical protein
MKYITTSQTPVYTIGANGFYRMVKSLPIGSLVTFVKTAFDERSNRPIGFLASGEIMYLDTLTRQLDEVVVKDTRLWDWLLWFGLAGAGLYLVTQNKK